MTKTLDIVGLRRSRAGARLIKGLARARRVIRGQRRPVVVLVQREGFKFPDARDAYARELAQLDTENFPMWRPDPERVRALQQAQRA